MPPLATVVVLPPLRQVEAVGVSTGQTSDQVARLKHRVKKKKEREREHWHWKGSLQLTVNLEAVEVYRDLLGMFSRRMRPSWGWGCLSGGSSQIVLSTNRMKYSRGVQFRQRVGLSWQEVQSRRCSSQLREDSSRGNEGCHWCGAVRGHRCVFFWSVIQSLGRLIRWRR